MVQRSNLVFRGRSEHTKRRQRIDILIKKAMKGSRLAKLKLYKEFGIRVYSSEEVEKYVQERVSQEYASGEKSATNGPTGVSPKRKPKGLSKNGPEQSRNKSSSSRAKSREKTKQLVKKV